LVIFVLAGSVPAGYDIHNELILLGFVKKEAVKQPHLIVGFSPSNITQSSCILFNSSKYFIYLR
jgi:hypothetical protein